VSSLRLDTHRKRRFKHNGSKLELLPGVMSELVIHQHMATIRSNCASTLGPLFPHHPASFGSEQEEKAQGRAVLDSLRT
jgi:hypothetical protein